MKDYCIRSFVSLGDLDPDFRTVISPIEARRLGRLLKRGLWCSVQALKEAGIEMPDAVITATDYGCMENSEAFLCGVLGVDDAAMRPVYFMQSTHNTPGSLIAIRLGCHGYNATFSHTGRSLLSALDDAITQIRLGDIRSALVCWLDERTPNMDASSLPGAQRAVAVVLTAPDYA